MGYGYYLNDPRFWRGVIDVLDASWEATEKRFAKYNKLNKDIMEEKKTKKMTKAEAFEYLKHKKVMVVGDARTTQNKLFKIGYKWCDGTVEAISMVDFLFIDDETFQFTESLSHFKNCAYEEISADDILSIEIIEEKKEKFVDCSEPCDEIKAVQELLRNSKHLKDKTLVITKDNAAIL